MEAGARRGAIQADPLRDTHLNLVDSARLLLELDPGASIEANERWMLGAGRSRHPVISNCAYRVDDRVDADELLERARDFFDRRGRGFSLWARGGLEADEPLIAAAEAAGLRRVYEMPEMVLEETVRAEERRTPETIELSRVATPADAEDYWRVAADSYASIGFPAEVFANYENNEALWGDGVATFIARVDGRAAAISMTVVSRGVAGIYWVGTAPERRSSGLGRVVTAAAVDAGLDLGGELASLQASPMGESLYRSMGFETIFSYQAFMGPGPT